MNANFFEASLPTGITLKTKRDDKYSLNLNKLGSRFYKYDIKYLASIIIKKLPFYKDKRLTKRNFSLIQKIHRFKDSKIYRIYWIISTAYMYIRGQYLME